MSWLLVFSVLASGCASELFSPDNHSTYLNVRLPIFSAIEKNHVLTRDLKTRIPSLYNLTVDQTSGSYWTSAFLTTTTGAQYLALSHILGPICKSSLLNLDTLEYKNHLEYGTTSQNSSASTSHDAAAPLLTGTGFQISAGNGVCALGSTSADLISEMYTTGSTPDYAYNLTWQSTSKVILNGGNGAFTFGPGFANSTEWSVPAGKTSGTLTIGDSNETLEIDSTKSMIWYDHQKGAGAPQKWTWFQLHFPNSSTKASIWSYDFGAPSHQLYQFATVRVGEESQYVLPFDMETRGCGGWASPKSNITYPQHWKLNFENGDMLDIKSIKEDQEIYGFQQLSDTVYAGYVNVSGKFLGSEVGFGVVEMIQLY
ncbi:hypothetical protein CNYM01_13631 [Colletotrichum nymphaeae SA-01]|uniref:AttH domain-containing protein n=1 Tax=Colletotrichum nymphaeae SA-01 TaxID=1460502 RepID=A0A135UXT7_9PEZI|nr:hypothetical protein CNYM01_13631 [Colletotrichum nymphaeae SA-01]